MLAVIAKLNVAEGKEAEFEKHMLGLAAAVRANEPGNEMYTLCKDEAGNWFDDNAGDWTPLVSGFAATFSGRSPGWDLPDRDLVMIDNTRLLHGRNQFADPDRTIYVRMCRSVGRTARPAPNAY